VASRRKKVGFHLSDLVATFRKDEAPASLLGRPREAKRNFAFNLRPILKSPVQKSLNIQLSSASFKVRRHRHVPISMHRAQDDESPCISVGPAQRGKEEFRFQSPAHFEIPGTEEPQYSTILCFLQSEKTQARPDLHAQGSR
jgi:hypothetical protein